MNERMIIELATKANLGPACEHQASAIKKFAELIVKECSAYVDGTGNWLVAMEMKQHFGVEE